MRSLPMSMVLIITVSAAIKFAQGGRIVYYDIYVKSGASGMMLNIWLNIHGENGRARSDGDNRWIKNMFFHGSTLSHFHWGGGSVGKVTALDIQFEVSTTLMTWQCDYIIVYDRSTRQHYYFDIDKLFTRAAGANNLVLDKKPSPYEKMIHKIYVEYGDGAQLNGEVRINCIGDHGESGMHPVTQFLELEDIGEITMVQLQHISNDASLAVSYVYIDVPSAGRTYLFTFNSELVNKARINATDPKCFTQYKFEIQHERYNLYYGSVKVFRVQLVDTSGQKTEYVSHKDSVPLVYSYYANFVPEFLLSLPCLGKIRDLNLEYNIDTKGAYSYMALEYIKVTDPVTGIESKFPFNKELVGECSISQSLESPIIESTSKPCPGKHATVHSPGHGGGHSRGKYMDSGLSQDTIIAISIIVGLVLLVIIIAIVLFVQRNNRDAEKKLSHGSAAGDVLPQGQEVAGSRPEVAGVIMEGAQPSGQENAGSGPPVVDQQEDKDKSDSEARKTGREETSEKSDTE